MKRELSSFDIYVITQELKEIKGSYINKIYQLSPNEILIRFRNIKTKQKDNIYIRNGDLICLSQKEFQTPTNPSNFSMTLRKYLANGRISDVEQHEFDRILKIKIEKKEGEYSLIIEFFSEGNIILVDPDGNIILPLIRQIWKHRKVKGREPYGPPPSQLNPFKLNKEDFSKIIKKSDSDTVRTLAVTFNLSGPFAEEICTRSKVEKNRLVKDLDDETISRLYHSLSKIIDRFKNNDFEPLIVTKKSKVIDVLPIKFESYTNVDFKKINTMIRGFENFIEEKKEEKTEKSNYEIILGKLQRQLSQQLKKIDDLQEKINIKKKEGDLIYLHYREIEDLLNEIKKVLELKEKKSEIEKINKNKIVKTFNPENNLLMLKLKDTNDNYYTVKIDFRKSVSKNAEKAYDDNKKLASKLRGAEKAVEKTRKKIKEIKKNEEKIKKKKTEKKTSKKEKKYWFERFRWFISSEGNIVIGGKDAKSNDLIVKKYLDKDDYYVHADIQGAPSVIVKNNNIKNETKEVTEISLKEACIFASSYSKAWKQFAESQAYWVLPEQVSKTPQSGEFVPRGAFIIRGKRNYHRCKLEIAIGVVEIEGYQKVMGGPVEAVKKWSDKYFVLQPGNIKKSDVSHKIAKKLDISIDNVQKSLPPGGASIINEIGI